VDTEVPHGGRHQVLKQPVDTLRSHLIAESGELDIEALISALSAALSSLKPRRCPRA
jgi:hypothetical protein